MHQERQYLWWLVKVRSSTRHALCTREGSAGMGLSRYQCETSKCEIPHCGQKVYPTNTDLSMFRNVRPKSVTGGVCRGFGIRKKYTKLHTAATQRKASTYHDDTRRRDGDLV